MMYLKLLGVVAVVELSVWSGLTQTKMTNSSNGPDQTFSYGHFADDEDSYPTNEFSVNGSGLLTVKREGVGHTFAADLSLNREPQTRSLLGASPGTDPNQTWTLSLENLDAGQEGTPKQRGLAVAATPEPSAYALFGLGVLLLIHRLRRHSR